VLLVLALAASLILVVTVRGDVQELEPVRLRVDNWRSAVWIWSTAPAPGVGFGGFGQAAQTVPFEVGNRPRHAHSMPLEWLAEAGPIGLLATVLFAIWLLKLIRDLWPRRPDLAVAVAVIPAHNLVDFSLYGSGVAAPWAVLVGWAVAERGRWKDREPAPANRPLVVAVAAAIFAVAILQGTSQILESVATSALPPAVRFEQARAAHRVAPWRVDPVAAMAVAALDSRDANLTTAAASEIDDARWLTPRATSIADLRSLLAEARSEGPTALSEA
jgi:hypothetical protein